MQSVQFLSQWVSLSKCFHSRPCFREKSSFRPSKEIALLHVCHACHSGAVEVDIDKAAAGCRVRVVGTREQVQTGQEGVGIRDAKAT